MYGRAFKCDVCNEMTLVETHPASQGLSADLIPEGWSRIWINHPARYSWDKDKKLSTMEGSFDCCSLSCVRSVVADADTAIPPAE